MKEIKIKVNKILFKVEVGGKGFVGYGLYRNNKALVSTSYPKDRANEVMMNIYRDLQEAIGYEIRHEIEKLTFK